MALVALLSACVHVRPARLTEAEPPSEVELDAARRVEANPCGRILPILFPGAPQACLGRLEEGAALASLGAAELATAVGVASQNGLTHSGSAVPLTAFQDVWVGSVMDWGLEHQRAHRLRLVPPERLPELALAPFSPDVLLRTEVWLGLIGMLGANLLVTYLVDGPPAFDFSRAGQPPNLFGRSFSPVPGGALAGGIGVALFGHVAIAEEAFFRGWLQSGLSRLLGETPGWIVGSLIFGATHSLNAISLPDDQRLPYLAIYVPLITALGGYLGFVYQRLGYSLAPSVALHFWYNLLLGAFGYALDPTRNPLSATVRLGF